ncbi:hypothetical protein [Coxiella endosymbiont of Rhipicephalus microplus]|nr:hypothetical protein [Coxiella endosymbiont of Rhipicephalus microplus]
MALLKFRASSIRSKVSNIDTDILRIKELLSPEIIHPVFPTFQNIRISFINQFLLRPAMYPSAQEKILSNLD